ncbi:Membrane protein involved in the export of O-antigen and teichoic acid [Micromonospora chaiyaphumensis]|uniref:Membrane protein involved in the export of O-antigen and teichoic acid n=2 Tax=Micromonospora chaiyaphumensis TaxID=307119 RepID=A0A1C4ZDE3_9ACTN|nr:Membrane protein involved in the export of O-antigen and teichoic acid [Micromonospora chaiyaphumensis]
MTVADTSTDRTGREEPSRPAAGPGDGFLGKAAKFLTGTLLRTLAQGALFVLLAREMPIGQYGLFVGVTALIAVVSPFASAGVPSLIFQSHADAPAAWARHLARGLVLTVTFGVGASVLVTAAGAAVWSAQVDPVDVAALAVADLVAWRLIEAVAASVQARGKVFVASVIPAVLHVCRLAAAVTLGVLAAGPVTLHGWAVTSALLSTVICLLVLAYGLRGAGLPPAGGAFGQVRAGLLFAVGLSAQSVYNDLDKVMLSKLGSPEGAAIYAAAYRVVDFAYTPGRAMAAVAYPRFFEAGRDGPRSALRLTRRLLPRYLAFSVPAALLLAACSGLMPTVFGDGYAAATTALQGLAALLVLKAIHYLAADTLSGSRLQGRRTVCQIAVGVVNAGLNVWLIPAYGWQGAVASSLVCDALLGVLLWGCVVAAVRRDRTPRREPTSTMERA